MSEHGNGRAEAGFRWTIGILMLIQMAVLGWMVDKIDDLSTTVYSGDGRSTRAILDERTATWTPIITQNTRDIIALEREAAMLKTRVERNIERIERLERRVGG